MAAGVTDGDGGKLAKKNPEAKFKRLGAGSARLGDTGLNNHE